MKQLTILLVFLTFAVQPFTAQNWEITSKHEIIFNSADASGAFKEMSGDVVFDPSNLDQAKFTFVVKVESISTGNFLKNSHAKGKNWFNAKKYPHIKFISNERGFKKTDKGYEVTGHLQMHGVNKQITIPFTFNQNALNAKFSVDRTDYGIGEKNDGVSKVIKIDATIPLNKK